MIIEKSFLLADWMHGLPFSIFIISRRSECAVETDWNDDIKGKALHAI